MNNREEMLDLECLNAYYISADADVLVASPHLVPAGFSFLRPFQERRPAIMNGPDNGNNEQSSSLEYILADMNGANNDQSIRPYDENALWEVREYFAS